MRISYLMMATLVLCCAPELTDAQSKRPVSADEYIQSSSPTASGGRITSRSVPGADQKKWITIAELPVRQDNSNADSRFADARFDAARGTSRDMSGQMTSRVSAQRPSQANIRAYPYPVSGNSRAAALTPSESVVASATTAPRNGSVRRTAYQGAGLNANAIRTAQNCDCPPGYGGFQVPAQTVPTINIQQPIVQSSPVAAPQGRLFVPGTDVNGQTIQPPAIQFPSNAYGGQAVGQANCPPGYGYTGGGYAGGIGTGGGLFSRLGNGWFSNWWRPLLTGRGAYQPVFDLGGLQPGTFLGKGLIGQPTAYVNNQPLRNILRYLTP